MLDNIRSVFGLILFNNLSIIINNFAQSREYENGQNSRQKIN
jgi:hypothetical protein